MPNPDRWSGRRALHRESVEREERESATVARVDDARVPGYSDYDEGAHLLELLRRRPTPTPPSLAGLDDALVSAPGIAEERWATVNRKFCELFASGWSWRPERAQSWSAVNRAVCELIRRPPSAD